MYSNFWHGHQFLGTPLMVLFPIALIVVIFWSLFWKAWGLWLAARRGEKVWFGVLLVLNTLGILEIIYIFWVAKRSDIKIEDKI